MNSSELWKIENDIAAEGYVNVCGVDEAGRGPLAGPVCAAAVILPLGWLPEGLNDSKKLSERRREALYDLIVENAISFGIAFAGVEEIESENILNATFLAMNRAIEQLDPQPSLAIIDGNQNGGIVCPNRTIVHGDALCASIAAASILAKVTRDRFMCDMAEKYPLYGFEKHKGYGAPQHRAAILQHGPCEIHRPSFLRKMLNGQ